MILSIKNQIEKYNLPIKGIIQIGSHYAEEVSIFDDLGVVDLILIEPLTAAFTEMQRRVGQRPNTEMLQLALGNEEGTATMYVETINEGQSSSLLKPSKHLEHYPHIVFPNMEEVKITKLDSLKFNRTQFNGIVIDVQGAELMVMQGAVKTLEHIDYIYSEVNREPLYENCTLVEDLDAFLSKFGFIRVETNFWGDGQSFGDAIYVKTDIAYSEEKAVAPEFNEESYLLYHPDVAQAVREFKFESGRQHYERFGRDEGRKWYTGTATNIVIPNIFQQPTYRDIPAGYPEGNTIGFERWYHEWIQKNNPATGRDLLPIYWTSFYVNNAYGTDKAAISELQKLIDKLDKTKKYYTICQYDNGILNDLSGLDIIIYSSGNSGKGYYPIPLTAMNIVPELVDYSIKDIMYSFTGSPTHQIRSSLIDTLWKHAPVSIEPISRTEYIEQMKHSIFALCPRGYGVTSFRIAEAMMYGCIPVYISDEFWEPFNLPFTEYGVKIKENEIHLIPDILAKVDYEKMRIKTAKYFNEYFTFEKAAENIVKTLI